MAFFNGRILSHRRIFARLLSSLVWIVNPVAFTFRAWRPAAFRSWYAFNCLGRFFTTNVAIARDYRVIDSGPGRFIRHPGNAGALMAALGLSLIFHNGLSLLIIFTSASAVQLWRIHVEEQALMNGLCKPCRNYMWQTKRLIPFVY